CVARAGGRAVARAGVVGGTVALLPGVEGPVATRRSRSAGIGGAARARVGAAARTRGVGAPIAFLVGVERVVAAAGERRLAPDELDGKRGVRGVLPRAPGVARHAEARDVEAAERRP